MTKQIPWQKYAYIVVVLAGVLFSAYLGFTYLLPAILPFLLAWGVAFLTRPISCWLEKKWHLPRRVGGVGLTLCAVLLLFLLLYWLGARLYREGQALFDWLKQHPDSIKGWMDEIHAFISRWLSFLPNFAEGGGAENVVENILQHIATFALDALPKFVGELILKMPGILIFVLVTVIASIYFALDLDKINQAVLGTLPKTMGQSLKRIKERLSQTAFLYVRTYFLLMLMTFAMLVVGFWILGVEYVFLLSAIFALVDILPVLGVGTMLIPWGLFCLATGQTGRGIGLLILYG